MRPVDEQLRRALTHVYGPKEGKLSSSSYAKIDRFFLPEEPQAKHHRPRVGLDVRDAPELATGLVD